MKKIHFFLILMSVLVMNSCSHQRLLKTYKEPQKRPQIISDNFPSKKILTYRETVREKHDRYKRIFTTLNLINEEEINLEIYRPQSDQPAPVILVMPITGGDYLISRFFCRRFVKGGFAVVFVHRQKKYLKFDNLNRLYPNLREMVLDHRTVLDWIETRPEFNSDATSAFGISLGGIKCTLLSGIDARIKTSVIALAGGDLPEILKVSEERGVRRIRNYFLNKNQYDQEGFYKDLKQRAQFDPLDYAPYMNAQNTLLFLAYFDNCVPYKNGDILKEKIGGPETITLPTGHYSSLFYIHYIAWKSEKFFSLRMKEIYKENNLKNHLQKTATKN